MPNPKVQEEQRLEFQYILIKELKRYEILEERSLILLKGSGRCLEKRMTKLASTQEKMILEERKSYSLLKLQSREQMYGSAVEKMHRVPTSILRKDNCQ